MTSTGSAIATALPNHRRAFLRQLASLPLIGGGVTLIGQPTAVAEPVTLDLMQSYKTWLHYEHRALSWEMANHPTIVAHCGGRREDRYEHIERLISHINVGEADSFHHSDGSAPASARAALVLSTVGCDWRSEHVERKA